MGADPPVYSSVSGPAKSAAIGVLCFACGGGLVWSMMRQPRPPEPAPTRPAYVQPQPPPLVVQPAPQPAPLLPLQTIAPITPPAPDTAPTAAPALAAAAPELAAPEPEPTPPPAPAVISGKININTASAAELELLPQIGPALAKRITDYRTLYGPFRSIADLDKVKGIGPKTLEKIGPLITVN